MFSYTIMRVRRYRQTLLIVVGVVSIVVLVGHQMHATSSWQLDLRQTLVNVQQPTAFLEAALLATTTTSNSSVNPSDNNDQWHNISSTPRQQLPDDNSTTTATTTTTTNTTTTNTTKLPRPHPHGGIRGPLGEVGYIHDATAIFRAPPPPSLTLLETQAVCAPRGSGTEGPEGDILLQHIQHHLPTKSTTTKSPRLLCAVYTYGGGRPRTNAILETWGPKCDGLFFASNETHVPSFHFQLPHRSRQEHGMKGIWQKVRSMLAYLHDHFLDDYDFFHLCGDDTYLIVDNLKQFLQSPGVVDIVHTKGQPFLAGFWMRSPYDKSYPPEFYYMGGGSGYTLSRLALQKFVTQALPVCRNKTDNSMEDVNLSWCFFHEFNVSGYDTRDEFGAHRYHQLSVYRHAVFPQRRFGTATFIIRKSMDYMHQQHGFPIVWGPQYVSNSSVTFHMAKSSAELKRYHQLLYQTYEPLCQRANQTQNYHNESAIMLNNSNSNSNNTTTTMANLVTPGNSVPPQPPLNNVEKFQEI